LGGCLRTVEADAFHPLICVCISTSASRTSSRLARSALSSGCVTGDCRSHLLGRPCAGFCTRCREDRCAGGAGTPLARLRFPSALVVASRACVSRLPARDTAVPLRLFRSSPRVLRWTGECLCLMASVALADFGRSNGSLACPRSPRSVGRDLDLVLSRVSGELSREHVAGLARDTHLWFLFEARRTYG